MVPNIECLIAAAKELAIPHEFLDQNQNLVRMGKDKPLYFLNFITPFNSEDVARICKDKEYTFHILKDLVSMPRTVGYLDPNVPAEFKKYSKFENFDAIADDIEKRFSFPLIVKRNAGSLGRNVFECKNSLELREKIQVIFSKDSSEYDYIALAQEKVDIAHEYRVVVLNGEIEILYEKDFLHATFEGNLSPLHWKNAKAVVVEDQVIRAQIADFIAPIFDTIPLSWGGLDVAIDRGGKLWLFELNSHPGFSYFIKDNGQAMVIELYKKALKNLKL